MKKGERRGCAPLSSVRPSLRRRLIGVIEKTKGKKEGTSKQGAGRKRRDKELSFLKLKDDAALSFLFSFHFPSLFLLSDASLPFTVSRASRNRHGCC